MGLISCMEPLIRPVQKGESVRGCMVILQERKDKLGKNVKVQWLKIG